MERLTALEDRGGVPVWAIALGRNPLAKSHSARSSLVRCFRLPSKAVVAAQCSVFVLRQLEAIFDLIFGLRLRKR